MIGRLTDAAPPPGCQDCLEYANRDKYQTPPVDGYILQSPVSDREAACLFLSGEDLDRSIRVAEDMVEEGRAGDAMPRQLLPPIFETPVTAYRWRSLAAKGYVRVRVPQIECMI